MMMDIGTSTYVISIWQFDKEIYENDKGSHPEKENAGRDREKERGREGK